MPAPHTDIEREAIRRRLLDVAARLFVRHGRAALTMRRLAAEVGYSTMALYRWFKNKDELLIALRVDGFNRLGDRLEAAYAPPGTPQERHRAVIAAYLGFAKENPNFYRVLFDTPFDEASAPQELLVARARLAVPMAAHTELARAEGLEVDIARFAGQMWAALHGAILLDDVGLYGLDVMSVHQATIEALIAKYRRAKP
jgi:AcrR family transcriptional regulator